MKVPISSTTQTATTTSKPLSCNNTASNTAFQAPNSISTLVNNNKPSYEPTPVLDLRRSQSPATNAALPLPTDAGIHKPKPASADLDNLEGEGWDSILSELGLNDDSNNPNPKLWSSQISSSCDSHLTQLPEFPSSQPLDHTPPPIINFSPSDYPISDLSYGQNLSPNFGQFELHLHQPNVNNSGLDFIEDLIRAAQAYESNNSHQVQLVLARLNQRLRSPAGKPLHRAAFYFKEALQHLAAGGGPARPVRLSSYEVVQTIRAHKNFAGISLISLFSTFAANQAILEAVDGAAFIHIIDFDIGFGGHWASFMRELVDKADPNKISSLMLRITAIVPEEFGIESKLVRENLTQFARDLNINFHIEYVLIQSFEILSFKSVKLIDGEKLAVHLSPAMFHRLQGGISKFLADLRGISPSTVVVVDGEVGIDTGTSSFSVNFVAGIEFYTGMLESLDVTSASGFAGGGGDAVRRIETYVLRPRIKAAVEAAAAAAVARRSGWREAFAAARMRAVGFSQFADFQAECLLRKVQVGGFHVAKRHGEMMLCWHDRPLVSTSFRTGIVALH
ncbi:hypothetical protein Cgig2_025635 [Carnegiea gigantea]|uniref:Scarecrow-like protein 15 n=1 Tax=Carnegiea gigantea TaxID=171969 RepID=A0A9Q1Q7C2_9CARY|nr:hypothetical protein Cgig2_025635 [Carnegiea gigantea]